MDKKYEAVITKLSNPDTFAEGLVDLRRELDVDETAVNQLRESNNSLRDVNARLALRVTEPIKHEDTPPEKTDAELFQELFVDKIKEGK